jgi:3-keto-disaccharide hydrolase
MAYRTACRQVGLAALMMVVPLVGTSRVVLGQGASQAAPAPPGGGQAPAGGGGRGGGGGGVAFGPPTTQTRYDDYTGFTKLFDGQTFTNWNGERDVWSIADGMLHADTTKTPGQHHIHYTGPGAVMRDFTLKVEVKLSADGANGGIQYRSRLLHPAHGGSIADPLGKPLPASVTTMAEAVAAGITAAPAARGAAPGGARGGGARGGDAPGGGTGPGGRGAAPAPAPGGAPGGAGTPPAGAAPPAGGGAGAAPAASACVGEVGNLAAAAAPAGRGNAQPATGNPWQVSGYQFDMDSPNQYTGQLYEGQGRNIITVPGTIGMLLPGNCKILLGKLPGDAKAAIKPHRGLEGEWQQIEIIVRGNTMIHMINGQVMSITVDDDPVARAPQGILSLQLEGSGQIWYRNVYLKAQ